MDLVAGADNIIVMMTHFSATTGNQSYCRDARCHSRVRVVCDRIITDLGYLEIQKAPSCS